MGFLVWWDPRALTLDQRPTFGIRRQELIEDPGPEVLEAERRRYQEWEASRELAAPRSLGTTFRQELLQRLQRRLPLWRILGVRILCRLGVLFDFRCFPIVGVAEPLGDGLLLTSRPRPIHPAGAGDQTAHNTRIGP
jgi:hypothetical protein